MVAQQSNGEWGSIAGGKDATQTFMNSNPLRTLSFDNWSKSTTENTMYDLGFDLKPIENLVISGHWIISVMNIKARVIRLSILK